MFFQPNTKNERVIVDHYLDDDGYYYNVLDQNNTLEEAVEWSTMMKTTKTLPNDE